MNMQQSGGQSHDHEGSLLTCKPLVSEQGQLCSSARELEVRSTVLKAVQESRGTAAQLCGVGEGKRMLGFALLFLKGNVNVSSIQM